MPWSRSDRGPSAELLPAIGARDGAVAAYIYAETLFSEVDTAVEAVRVLYPDHPAAGPWPGLRAQYLEAGASYLNATAQFDLDNAGRRLPPGFAQQAAHAYGHAHRQLDTAIRAIAAYRDRNSELLHRADAAVKAIPRTVQAARVEAAEAKGAAEASEFTRYLSVERAVAALDEALAQLERAATSGDLLSARDLAATVGERATAVRCALEEAPHSEDRARSALVAVRTRIDAMQARFDTARQAHSALLREFSARCSQDLAHAERAAEQLRAQAEDSWRQAREELARKLPDNALDTLGTARELLGEAERSLSAVTGRLQALRRVRADPAAAAESARFRIRDASHLVRDNGLVQEWGSVLSAQLDRVERAQRGLVGAHPDYWAYLQQLDAVEKFVTDVIDRVRGRAGKPSTRGR
jgi:predicted  nucleic acid-binding Zn-ribbon protein